MTTRNRTWLTAAAAVGAGALVLGGSALPAFAETTDATVVEPLVSEPFSSGEATLDALSGDALATVAERHGMQQDTLENLLSEDQAGIAPGGFVYFKDKWDIDEHDHSSSDADAANVPGDPEGGSRPDAPVTVYLDFDGETVEDTLWNGEHGIETIEASPAAVADEEFQRQVWELVAEDYAPFDVNVTTARPSDEALYKADEDDNGYGSHVVITDSYEELPFAAGSGGVAFLGGTGAHFLSPAWVFTTGVSGVNDPSQATPKAVADAATHEVGHNFGLAHDGIGDHEYYAPQDGVWGPIMGAPYGAPLTQWSNGDYAGATNQEDDLSIISDRGAAASVVELRTQDGDIYFGSYCTTGESDNPQPGDEFFLPNEEGTCNPPGEELVAEFEYTDRADHVEDNHGDDTESASALDNAEGAFEATGVISQSDDVDVFSLATTGGPATVDVAPSENAANLDVALTLTDAEGNVVAEANPETTRESGSVAAGLGASLSEDLEGGLYYLTVEGAGQGNGDESTPEAASGYSGYGSLGYYTVTGEAEPFDADPITITAPEDGAEVEAGELEVTGSATPGAEVAVTAGGAGGEATASDDGSWSTTIDELPYGDTTIEAQQTVEGITVPETASVAVTVPVDAPVITKPEDGQTSSSPLPSFAGTGISDATVNIAIDGPGDDDAEAASVSGEVTVDDEGNWEFAPESDLADGEYTVTATQSINDVTSDSSDAVAFTVEVGAGDDDGSDDGSEDGSDDGDASGDAGGSEDGDDGGLPDTGSSSLGLLILAAGLVALGGAAAWNARTRRSTV